MSNEQTQPPMGGPCTLTPSQTTRVEYAQRDLDYARSEELTDLPAAGLIVLVEKLRGRLDDMLRVINELRGPADPKAPRQSDTP